MWGNVVCIPTDNHKVGNKYRGVSKRVDSQHMLFTSTHELSIDSKNRLSIPASIRSAMDAKQDGTRFYLVPGDWNRTLNLYSDKYFEQYAEKYHASLEPGPEKQMFETVFHRKAAKGRNIGEEARSSQRIFMTLFDHFDFIDYAVDRNPYKHGKFLPGSHIPVFGTEKIAETKPDYVLILPWNLKTEIVEQLAYVREWGGELVVPVPELEIC